MSLVTDQQYKLVIRRYTKAKSAQQIWLNLMLQAYNNVMPNRVSYYSQYFPAQQLNTPNVFDTTAIDAVNGFTSMIQASLTPPKQQWVKIKVGSFVKGVDKAQLDELQQQLTEVQNTVFEYLHSSNFDDANNQSYFDLAFGTGALLCNEGDDDNPFIFESQDPFFLYPENGPYGNVETIFRDLWQIKIEDIQQMWKGSELSDQHKQLVEQDASAAVNITDGVVYHPATKKYQRLVWDTNSNWVFIDEELDSSPWIVFRWRKQQAEVFGRGPILDALPSVKTTIALMYDLIMSSNFAAQPAYFGSSDGQFNPNTAQVKPGTIIPINAMNGQQPLQLIPRNEGAVRDTYQGLLDSRAQVNNMLYANPLGPVDAPNKTATELTLRQQQLLTKIGPAFGRLYVELINPLVNRCLYILGKKGLIPKLHVDGKQIQFEYVSPIAQSQKLNQALGLQQMSQLLVATVGPQLAVQALNLTELPEFLADAYNVPFNLVKTPAQLQAIIAEVTNGLMQAQQNIGNIAPEVGGQARVGGPSLSADASQSLLASGGF